MDAYPNSEDEFELQYGDDLQVLNELDGKYFINF